MNILGNGIRDSAWREWIRLFFPCEVYLINNSKNFVVSSVRSVALIDPYVFLIVNLVSVVVHIVFFFVVTTAVSTVVFVVLTFESKLI